MDFRAPWMLPALLLIALPVCVHWFLRPRRKTVHWPLMQLLLDVERQRLRARQLRDRWLLLLRCAAVAAIALSLADPVLHLARGSWWNSWRGGVTVVFIDASASLGRGPRGDRPIDAAVAAARDVIQARGEHAQLVIVGAAGDAAELSAPLVGGTSEAEAALGALLEPHALGGHRADLWTALAEWSGRPEADQVADILVYTDGQSSSWRPTATAPTLDLPVALQLIRFEASSPIDQIWLTDFQLADPVAIEPGAPLELLATIVSQNEVTLRCRVRDDRRELLTRSLDLPAGSRQERLLVELPSGSTGQLTLSIETEAGERIDQRSLVAPVASSVPVLCLEPANAETSVDSSRFLRAFLGGDLEQGATTLFAPRRAGFDELSSLPTDEPAILVCSDTPSWNEAEAAALDRAVQAGANLLIFLGPGCDLSFYRRDRSPAGVLPLPFGEPVGVPFDQLDSPDSAWRVNTESVGALVPLDESWRAALQSLRVSRCAPLPGEVLAELENGAPLIVQRDVGLGRVLVVTTSCDSSWSNFPVAPALAVLDRCARQLVARSLSGRTLRCASAGDLGLTEGSWQLPGSPREVTSLAADRSLAPGFAIRTDEAPAEVLALQPSRDESDPTAVTGAQIHRWLPDAIVATSDNSSPAVPPREIPIAQTLIALALLLLAVEAWESSR